MWDFLRTKNSPQNYGLLKRDNVSGHGLQFLDFCSVRRFGISVEGGTSLKLVLSATNDNQKTHGVFYPMISYTKKYRSPGDLIGEPQNGVSARND